MNFGKSGQIFILFYFILFYFIGPNILCCLKTGNILLVTEQKYAPQKTAFSAFVCHGKLTTGHGEVIGFYCPISV